MLNVLIVDDEAPAHEVLVHHCRAHADVRIVGQCHSAAEALAAICVGPVDLMLLDVRMPRFGGLDLLRGLSSPPLTVIVSAHRDHALDGYELDVIDYLLKPVSAQRFAAALEKVRRRLDVRPDPEPLPQQDLVLKVDRSLRRFRLDEIACCEAQGNFVRVWTDTGPVLVTSTLSGLLASLPADRFVQVHRSYIVNRGHVTEQQRGLLRLRSGQEVPIGKNFRFQQVLAGRD